jgi:pectate disaccharide-lyase
MIFALLVQAPTFELKGRNQVAEFAERENPLLTLYVKARKSFNLEDIEFASIRLNGEIKPISDKGYSKNPIADYDADGDMEFMVKFSRKEISRLLEKGVDVPVTITGQLKSSKVLYGETKVTVK